ncbi:four-carbon acid sugar kinase family protein [Burkholderia gladioli]|uniref:four-carbon acid sugar kinase family protein n=1 Tax=Burkholderia gladioli TaxID=28095 RepID=UPI0022D2D1C6|nr:four-carbon acid sugar kinase family protein [Burkholderia gladioli]MDA0575246.1 four-carbon acid sugar kinase family protein [Burkholderia gladioli]MDA0603462.1 four-carbon acid sugar kinase family protein [Burkholderia gladioli]
MRASGLLIVADDLSGAADCAIAFAAAGLRTVVSLDASAPARPAAVLAVDTDTRRLAPAEAARRAADAWRAQRAPGRRLYKKIDSTLRGNWAAEVAALAALAGPAIVAPAFPATGRGVIDGRVLVRGVPLEDTETWQLEHAGRDAALRALLEDAGLRVEQVGLEVLRGDPQRIVAMLAAAAAEGVRAIVVDAETSEDLARLARLTAALDTPFFWVGSGGLSRELAALPELFEADAAAGSDSGVGAEGGAGAESRSAEAASVVARGPLLTLVGSLSAISERQCALLRAEAGIAEFIVPPAVLREGAAHAQWHAWRERIGACLRGRQDAIVRIGRDAAFDPAEGALLSGALAALVAPHVEGLGGLIVTGGETARAMLGAARIGALELAREIEAGVALGRPADGRGPHVVTKAGAFGTEHALLGAYRHLRGEPAALARGGA